MKKILFGLLALFLVTGCTDNENKDNNVNNPGEGNTNINEVDYSKYVSSDATLVDTVEKKVTLNGKEYPYTTSPDGTYKVQASYKGYSGVTSNSATYVYTTPQTEEVIEGSDEPEGPENPGGEGGGEIITPGGNPEVNP